MEADCLHISDQPVCPAQGSDNMKFNLSLEAVCCKCGMKHRTSDIISTFYYSLISVYVEYVTDTKTLFYFNFLSVAPSPLPGWFGGVKMNYVIICLQNYIESQTPCKQTGQAGTTQLPHSTHAFSVYILLGSSGRY